MAIVIFRLLDLINNLKQERINSLLPETGEFYETPATQTLFFSKLNETNLIGNSSSATVLVKKNISSFGINQGFSNVSLQCQRPLSPRSHENKGNDHPILLVD